MTKKNTSNLVPDTPSFMDKYCPDSIFNQPKKTIRVGMSKVWSNICPMDASL